MTFMTKHINEGKSKPIRCIIMLQRFSLLKLLLNLNEVRGQQAMLTQGFSLRFFFNEDPCINRNKVILTNLRNKVEECRSKCTILGFKEHSVTVCFLNFDLRKGYHES